MKAKPVVTIAFSPHDHKVAGLNYIDMVLNHLLEGLYESYKLLFFPSFGIGRN